MSLDYCDILATWTVARKRNIQTVFSYQIAQSDIANEEEEEENPGDSEKDMNTDGGLMLQDTEEEISGPCILYLTCKTPYNVSITGLEIVSESRTQELYDVKDNYMSTISARGTHICSDDTVLHRTKIQCSQPLDKCSVKFLSLRGKREFHISRVIVRLVQGKCEPPPQPPSSKFNLEKVKELVDSMEGTMSDRAQSFMNTMEQYQQNQESAVADVECLLSQMIPQTRNSLQPSPGGMAGMMAMLSTMNKLSSTQIPTQSDNPAPAHDHLSHPTTPGQLLNGENGSTGENPAQVFSFLKSICGEVSKMRDMEDERKLSSQSTSGSTDDTSKNNGDPGPGAVFNQDLSALEQRIIVHVDRTGQKLQRYIDSRMGKFERRINRKLDALVDLLTQAIQGQGGMDESSDESSSSATELDLD